MPAGHTRVAVAPDLPAQRGMLFVIPDELASDGIDLQMGVTCLDCASAVVISMWRGFAALRRLGKTRTQAVQRTWRRSQ